MRAIGGRGMIARDLKAMRRVFNKTNVVPNGGRARPDARSHSKLIARATPCRRVSESGMAPRLPLQGRGHMVNLAIGIGVGVLTFAAAYLGMWGQKWLPAAHMTSGARDMIGAVMGLIALLLALVLGTLVGSAYGFYATQKANTEVMAARAIQLDIALRQFGPEATPLRAAMQTAMAQAYKAVWIDNFDPRGYGVENLVSAFSRLNEDAAKLQAKTPDQIAALPTINASLGIIEQTRLLMALQIVSPISWPLVHIVVSWALVLFLGYGVLARLNGTAIIAAIVGGFAVGSAMFLILELNQPFTGLFRIPGSSMQQAVAVLNK